jgi:hypothetical protein
MKAASRVVVCAVVIAAAGSPAAYAVNPASNGVGDGEANVPFASPLVSPQDAGRADDRARDRDRGTIRDRSDRGDRDRSRRDRDGTGSGSSGDRAEDSDSSGPPSDRPSTGQ